MKNEDETMANLLEYPFDPKLLIRQKKALKHELMLIKKTKLFYI